MTVGTRGAIGSTVAIGLEAVRRGLRSPSGIRTETARLPVNGSWVPLLTRGRPLLRDALGLAPLDGIVASGWDRSTLSLSAAARKHGVVDATLLAALDDVLPDAPPYAAVERVGGEFSRQGRPLGSAREACDLLRRDIAAFRTSAELDEVVVVNLMPTAPPVMSDPAFETLPRFEAALESSSPVITAGMLYFYAACREGCSHINFTPNLVELPALRELAARCGVPFAGRDGKTGQTFLKTVLASAFRSRDLHVRGWFSTNILGNSDGLALSSPDALSTKVTSKLEALEQTLGYPVTSASGEPAHLVSIHYYPPRGDAKEAWDNIDLCGFLDAPMQVKVNFLCQDSALAAPLVLDLVRFAAHARRRGEAGVLDYLSGYFKTPLTAQPDQTPEHDFFAQDAALARYVEAAAAAPHPSTLSAEQGPAAR